MSAITKSQIYIRRRTLDSCLKESSRKWSLNGMIIQCNKVLSKEYGTKVSVSVRTIQADIEYLRNNVCPIEVYGRKYYRYAGTQSQEEPVPGASKSISLPQKHDNIPSVKGIVEQMRELMKAKPEYNWLEPFAFQIENHTAAKPASASTPGKISRKIVNLEPDLFSQPDEPEMFTLF